MSEDHDQIITIAQIDDPNLIYQRMQTRSTGLNEDEVSQRQRQYGKNILKTKAGEPIWLKFLKNFSSTMAILLWISGAIAFLAQLQELGIAIWAVNLINGCFSFWQEYQAGKATEALSKMLPAHSRVVRNGVDVKILAEDLVPGDIIKLEEGDDIPADIRLLQTTDVQVNQSSLTGEVNPVHKNERPVTNPKTNHFELTNIVFSGTSMMKGNATGVVVTTGMATDFGKIAALTQNVHDDQSPLQKELSVLTKQISILAVSIGLIFFLVATFFVHYPLVKSFIFALGMIVAFIPEGLLPTVTLSLAGAVQQMAKKNALVKKLSSVETLGSASVICSDKTGTLTQNQMTVSDLWTVDKHYRVDGEGYAVNGKIYDGPHQVNYQSSPDLYELLRGGLLADNARIMPPDDQHPRYTVLGDPTEACLEVVAAKGGLDLRAERTNSVRLKELPFDSDRKMMTVIQSADTNHQFNTYTKGAPNVVVAHCDYYLINGEVKPLGDDIRQQILADNDAYAKQGLRVLAVAGRTLPDNLYHDLSQATNDTVEQALVFIGLSVMLDPPRKEVLAAAKLCHQAHIKIIMVTGDYSLTAESIAKKIGLVDSRQPLRVVTGEELGAMTDDDLKTALSGEIVFARMAPEQKYRVVNALQEMSEVVAVTGDGVNDAPALKKADIGVAMGVTGTDVAKEAADMILTDDNFASIVEAIREGRGVYANIRKFLLYILNSNMPEVIPSVLFLLSGGKIPLALTVMQILAIDLGTDMIPALGLGKQRVEAGIMDRPPRKMSEHLINRRLVFKAFGWYGLLSSIISVIAFFYGNLMHGYGLANLPTSGNVYVQATTITLGAIIFCQIAAVLNIRYNQQTMFTRQFWDNSMITIGIIFEIALFLCLSYVPILQSAFQTAPLNAHDWYFLMAIPIPLILIDEFRKWLLRRQHQ